MIIFGLDPGIAIVGYGIIEAIGNRVRLIDYGVIETKAGIPLPDRLKIIDEELNKPLQDMVERTKSKCKRVLK